MIHQTRWDVLIAVALFAFSCQSQAIAGRNEDRTIQAAHEVIQQFRDLQYRQIPDSLMADAHAVAIIPDVIKLGFVVGGQRGHGVVIIRQPDGAWRAPVFITITGGSIGWQAGAQATDFVLVFKSQKSVDGLMRGKFTLGADAAIAAGPVGRRAGASTDTELKAEIYSYSRSRGLFAGVSLEGSALQINDAANNSYYGQGAVGGLPPAMPPSAQSLVQIVASLTTRTTVPPAAPAFAADTAAFATADSIDLIQVELAQSATNLTPLLNDTWKQFLAMPAEIYDPSRRPSPEAVAAAVQRFTTVAQDPQYQAISTRFEFQTTLRLLQRLDEALRVDPRRLALPPPPVATP
jgi:lipid-binding SYLF domain-containing protein